MADFYTVLINSLHKRDIADPAARERVYLRARMALIRKLWGQRPRMSDREIEDEVAVFDIAVGLVESDVAASLPAPRRERLRREKAVRMAWEQQVPDIKFDITEREVEAEADPEEADRLAYRTHLREAATRANQWAESMVQRIDPVSVARTALASATARPALGHLGVAAVGPTVHETVLAEPIINVARERSAPPPGRRGFRSFFPQRSAAVPADLNTDASEVEPGRMHVMARRVIVFFEQLSERLYEGSVAEQRRRRGRLTPRVYIRPPSRAGGAELLQRRRRRQLALRLATPLVVFAALVVLGWLGAQYQTEITTKIEEFSAPSPTETEEVAAAPIEAKGDDAAATTAIPEADIVLFDGRDPSLFHAGGGKPVVFGSDAAGGYVRIQTPPAGEEGARLIISSGVADRLAQRTARFVVTARAPVEDGAGTIRLGYRAGAEAGPFAAQPLGREYRRLEIAWTVPGGSALGEHALLIEPGLLGGGHLVDVKAVEIFLEPRP